MEISKVSKRVGKKGDRVFEEVRIEEAGIVDVSGTGFPFEAEVEVGLRRVDIEAGGRSKDQSVNIMVVKLNNALMP